MPLTYSQILLPINVPSRIRFEYTPYYNVYLSDSFTTRNMVTRDPHTSHHSFCLQRIVLRTLLRNTRPLVEEREGTTSGESIETVGCSNSAFDMELGRLSLESIEPGAAGLSPLTRNMEWPRSSSHHCANQCDHSIAEAELEIIDRPLRIDSFHTLHVYTPRKSTV
jgi:hypothetical protein